ncbi:ornithine cyclodeaminase [Microbacterium sp. NPDC058345]|uniref:ornithine cyclodeaminase n=1 Tax=Microbacterium sp. NPDC058345 TaxID=3346455 RepID=UPI00365542F1
MTGFVGVDDMVRWISRHGAERLMTAMTDCIEADFRRWTSFDKTERVASHTPFGVIELMPIADHDVYSFKYVNGHPSNPARGFQTVTAFGVLADVHNGYPVFVAEMTLLTALRTAATSAMAARALAREDSQVLALIGAGSQAEFQALAFRGVLGISKLRVFDIDRAATQKLTRNLHPLGFEIEVCESASEATRGADIVTTCTADKTSAQVLDVADIAPGMHINAIGGDCPGKTELDPRILECGPVFVEYEPQTRIEGEIQLAAPDLPVTELWQVLTERAPGRVSADQITIFDSVGFAIEDYSALRFLRDSVHGSDVEAQIDLVAAPDDPKDLFGMVGASVLV